MMPDCSTLSFAISAALSASIMLSRICSVRILRASATVTVRSFLRAPFIISWMFCIADSMSSRLPPVKMLILPRGALVTEISTSRSSSFPSRSIARNFSRVEFICCFSCASVLPDGMCEIRTDHCFMCQSSWCWSHLWAFWYFPM